MTERTGMLRELVELEEEAERLTAAIADAEARADAARASRKQAEPAFTELGEMVLDVQRQLDEMEAAHTVHCQHLEAAAEREVARILADGEARARSIEAALAHVMAADGRAT